MYFTLDIVDNLDFVSYRLNTQAVFWGGEGPWVQFPVTSCSFYFIWNYKACWNGDWTWIWNPRLMPFKVQNWGISGPTKVLISPQKVIKKKNTLYLPNTFNLLKDIIIWTDLIIWGGIHCFKNQIQRPAGNCIRSLKVISFTLYQGHPIYSKWLQKVNGKQFR